jgi:hypothetical protein
MSSPAIAAVAMPATQSVLVMNYDEHGRLGLHIEIPLDRARALHDALGRALASLALAEAMAAPISTPLVSSEVETREPGNACRERVEG